ncbi:hypothetical protein TRIP_C21176 [Candidatus Zixiibacteriota bacterium]|nr:hypothetical protein TRIP_C21176 [candidate division Zixibacteria bacterium]
MHVLARKIERRNLKIPRVTSYLKIQGFFLIIFVVFIMPGTADQLTAPVKVASSGADGSTLGIPRWKGYMSELDPNQFWLSYASAASSAGSMNYTTDGGNTWSTDIIQIDFNGWLDMHLSLFGRNGNLYFTWPGVHFRKFSAPAHSNDDRGALVTLSGTTDAHRSNIMVQNTGRIWVFTRDAGTASENVKYQYSDNEGSTWTTGMAYSTNAANVRIGSMPYVGGNPALVVEYLDDSRGFEYYLWNGSSFQARSDHSIYPVNMGQTRVFTHNVINDTTMHLVFGDANELHHCWKNFNNGSGSWNHEIIDNSPYTADNEWFVTSTVKGSDLYIFYSKKTSSDAASSMIYYKKWSQTNQTWTAPVLVSTAAGNISNRDPNTCFHVPNNANYIPVFWNSGDGGIYFAKIILNSSGDTVPPGKINDLGAIPGSGLGEATLSWTAPGDDGYSGTAQSYIIKFDTLPIADASWPALAAYANPPAPLPAGQHQTCSVSGLTPGNIYFFAVRASDEAGNLGALSNVKSLDISLDVSENNRALPSQSRLIENYPNPFNAGTTIQYSLASRARVRLSIYDILGRKINTLVDAFESAGFYSVPWNGTDFGGRPVGSGVYFCRMTADSLADSRKLLLLK